jgi:hypothetical protein
MAKQFLLHPLEEKTPLEAFTYMEATQFLQLPCSEEDQGRDTTRKYG